MQKVLLIGCFTLLSAVAQAADLSSDERYMSFGPSITEELSEYAISKDTDLPPIPWPTPGGDDYNPYDPYGSQPHDAISGLDRIVNLAKKVFDIIKDNQPVIDVTVNYANAVPEEPKYWTHLQDWSAPQKRGYEIYWKNLYGVKVMSIKYMVLYTYGGNYKGVGRYLNGVSVQPLSVKAAWGYALNLTCEAPQMAITNVGKSEEPVASMQLIFNWKGGSMLKKIDERDVYYIRGMVDSKNWELLD